jgi:DNA-binding MarR family transcriptional regulator
MSAVADPTAEMEVGLRLVRAENEAEFWRKLAFAKVHPIQLWVLHVLEEELALASPKKLEDISGHPLSTISYHCRALEKAGFLKIVKTGQVRGAVEHFYAATRKQGGA